MQGSEWGIKQTWHQVITISDLAVFNKSQKSTTASRPLYKLVPLTTRHIMISGLHHSKDDMIVLLMHVDMMLKKNHTKIYEKDKSISYNKFQ